MNLVYGAMGAIFWWTAEEAMAVVVVVLVAVLLERQTAHAVEKIQRSSDWTKGQTVLSF